MKTHPLMPSIDWESYERVVVLSPHLDDAVLSCGGLLHSLRDRVSTLVVTLCCADPPSREGGASKPTRPRKGHAPPGLRRREDMRAMHLASTDFVHLGFADGVFRRSSTSGELIYRRARENFTLPRIDDAAHVEELYLVLRRLCSGMGKMLIFSPMGIGHHVDHIICAQVALRLESSRRSLLFYEDFPYVVSRRVGAGGEDGPMIALGRLGLDPVKHYALPIDVEAKLELLGCYESQIPILFESEEKMKGDIRNQAFEGRPAELFWKARVPELSLEKEAQ